MDKRLLIFGALLAFNQSIVVLFVIIATSQVISAIIWKFEPEAANKRFDEVSP
jgi:hypothetical protein